MSLNGNPNKSSKSNENEKENEMHLKLIEKLSKMTNDEIGKMLYNFIVMDETSQFISHFEAIKLLQFESKEEEKEKEMKSKENENKISLHYIVNKALYGNYSWPLIVTAVSKNNIEIVQTLLSNGNDYQVRIFLIHFCFCFCLHFFLSRYIAYIE